MTVQERLGAFGDWSVTLSQETPDEILEALKEYQMGTLYITPSRVDWRKVHPKEVARYAGIYQKREFTDDRRTISGCSLLLLLGNGQGRGSGVDLTPIDLTGESFTDALTAAIADTDIQVGNIVPEIGGLPSGNFLLQDARHKVEEITKQFGAEYKITPKAELDAGSPASLWPTFNAPVVFIKRGAKGVDSDWKPLPIASSAMGEDVINFATQKIIAADQDGVPVIQGQATIASSKRGPNGTLLEITSVSADSQVGQAAANARAAALLALENAPRQTVSLSTDEFDIDGTVVVGDTVSVWNPEVGFFDIDNHIIVQGEHYFPLNLRVFGATWPITEGMGVYLRPPTASGDDNIFDLSPYLVPESGSTDLEVGAAARKLVPSPTESLGPVIAPVVNPDAPPPIPDPPTIFSEERSVLVKQPTTSGGNPMPATVTKFNVYASTTSGFTPGPTNYIGYISVVRADVITLGIPLLKSFKWEEDALTYFRTTAINSGGEGPASIEVAETAGLIPNAAILNLDAEKINAGTINVAIELNAAVINGGLITGGTVQTALSGQRVALEEGTPDTAWFYTGHVDETTAGRIRSVASDGQIALVAPFFDGNTGGAETAAISLYSIGGPSPALVSTMLLRADSIEFGRSGATFRPIMTRQGDAHVDLNMNGGDITGISATGDEITDAHVAFYAGGSYLDMADGGAADLTSELGGRFYADDIAEIGALGSTQMWIDGGEPGIVGSSAFEFEVIGVGVKRLRIGVADSGGAGKRLVFVDN